jgi:hypothetical protein
VSVCQSDRTGALIGPPGGAMAEGTSSIWTVAARAVENLGSSSDALASAGAAIARLLGPSEAQGRIEYGEFG